MFKKIIMVLLVVLSLTIYPHRGSADDPVITLEQHIQRIFGSQAKVALAVFKHESDGLKLDAKNWNCYYYKTDKNGKVVRYSTFCKAKDRNKAWSVDCGQFQINIKGQVCPPKLYTLEGSIPYVERIYKEQGLKAWVSFSSGAYKKYL